MVFIYLVRCNFTRPEKEEAWNAWYSGPKIRQMLAKPYFHSCQRFRLAAGTGRNYLTLWTLESPQAFETQEYTSDWGFFEWAPYVSDWSRDLFKAPHARRDVFKVPSGGALHLISFDGRSEAEAKATIPGQSGPDMIWLPIAGLDRHTPMIGLRVLAKASHPISEHLQAGRTQAAIYTPICPCYEA
jgi:hypothetical protein